MIHKKVVFKIKNSLFLASGIVAIVFLVLGIFLSGLSRVVKNNNLRNLDTLNKALPNFNEQTFTKFKQGVNDLQMQFIGLSNVFDPKYKWIKKDYDLSIHFIEELGKINQFLKIKAQGKGLNYIELDFKEKLPAEKEAVYLLNQLFGLKEVMNLSIDYGINFKSVSPLEVEELKDVTGIKQTKSRLELSCPAQILIEFIIGLNEIVPRVCFRTLILSSQDSFFNLDLTLNHIVIDSDILDKLEISKIVDVNECSLKALKKIALQQENFIYALRSNDPFFVSLTQEKEASSLQGQQAEELKSLTRFYYQGKALLRSKEVVVIEDVLNQETVFLAPQERIGNFILKEFTNDEAVLKNIDDGKETIIKRGEK